MIKLRLSLIIILASASYLITACGGRPASDNSTSANNGSSAQANSNITRTNVEELGVLIAVPYTSEDVVWREYAAKKRIVAVMRFSAEEADRVVADAGTAGNTENSIAVESWFPDELIAQSEMSGDGTLKGVSYPARAFVQEPYSNGKITRIDGTSYFILEMFAG